MDTRFLEDILEALDNTEARYFKIENSKKKIEIIRQTKGIETGTPPQAIVETYPATERRTDTETYDLTSPNVGFFQRGEAKGGKSLVKLREIIGEGKIVAHILSMNLQYEVINDTYGKIIEVLVEDGQAVEYGQPLFRLKPLSKENE